MGPNGFTPLGLSFSPVKMEAEGTTPSSSREDWMGLFMQMLKQSMLKGYRYHAHHPPHVCICSLALLLRLTLW